MQSLVDKFLKKIQKNFKSQEEIEKDDIVVFITKTDTGIGIRLDVNNKPKEAYYELLDESKKSLSIGICKGEYFDKFEEDYKKDFSSRYQRIKDFVSKSNKEEYLHISNKKIVELEELNTENYYLKSIFTFNPSGLWYSCGTAWLDFYFGEDPIKVYFDKIFGDIRERRGISEIPYNIKPKWYPWHVYVLNLDRVKIGEIEDCNDLFSFSKKYKSRNPREDRYLSLKKIKKDYDGIQICPYLGIKCNSFFKKMLPIEKTGKNTRDMLDVEIDWFRILALALNGKISKKDQSIIWSYSWEASTGVVLKNINKIGLKKLI